MEYFLTPNDNLFFQINFGILQVIVITFKHFFFQ